MDASGPAMVELTIQDGTVRLSSQLSLRDYFAAKAMQSIVLGMIRDQEIREGFQALARQRGIKSEAMAAQSAYEQADAMLLERAK